MLLKKGSENIYPNNWENDGEQDRKEAINLCKEPVQKLKQSDWERQLLLNLKVGRAINRLIVKSLILLCTVLILAFILPLNLFPIENKIQHIKFFR